MSFFDSPIAPCKKAHEMVLLDETQKECALEHHCPPGCECPLEGCFTTVSGVNPGDEELCEAAHHEASRP